GQNGIFFPLAVPGEDLHRCLLKKCCLYFFIRQSVVSEVSPPVTSLHFTLENIVMLFPDRSIFYFCLCIQDLLKCWHMGSHCFLCILLHAWVDGGVNLQAILIDIVFLAVGFFNAF